MSLYVGGRILPVVSALSRVRLLHFVLLLSILLCGCAPSVPPGRDWVRPAYREKIEEWQARIRREGWSENNVHSMLLQFRGLAAYRMEIVDHWDTPVEFMKKGFSGDCEDITVFMMGTLRRLGYDHGVRVLIVEGLFEDHALLRVEMPEGGWKVYDVVPTDVPVRTPAGLRPVVEFDEALVNWFPRGAKSPSGDGKTGMLSAGGS
jgi:hypothetical protein